MLFVISSVCLLTPLHCPIKQLKKEVIEHQTWRSFHASSSRFHQLLGFCSQPFAGEQEERPGRAALRSRRADEREEKSPFDAKWRPSLGCNRRPSGEVGPAEACGSRNSEIVKPPAPTLPTPNQFVPRLPVLGAMAHLGNTAPLHTPPHSARC